MAKVVVDVDNKKCRIAPEIYGQFSEHLGRGIYEGIFVGEDSEIPNVKGMRKDVVEALKNINIPLLRWPGGCFADEYHWKDGIGPKENRPSIVNSNWGGVVEDNSFGTHEFMELCEQLGAEPYINGNLGSGTVREMQEWIEYLTCADMNSPMAKLRAENGREEPWKLKWFGIGNENWGCGGNMCPTFYAQEYKRYQTFVRNYGENRIRRIAGGPNVDDYFWMEEVMKNAVHLMDDITMHYYTYDGVWEDKGQALVYDENGWYYCLHNAYRMEDLIYHHLAIMDRYDPAKRVGLIIDEWGTWHQVEEGTHPGFLYQQNTIRDALVASMTFDIFNKHADRITMANIAQTVNVLQAMILTDKEKMLLTPTYHVFDLYKVHQGAMLLDSWVSNKFIDSTIIDRQGKEIAVHLPSLSMTASEDEEGIVNITISNFSADIDENVEFEILAKDTDYNLISSTILNPKGDIKAHNTFDNPENIKLENWDKVEVLDNKNIKADLPAASVLQLRLLKK